MYLVVKQQVKHLSKQEYLDIKELCHVAKNLTNEAIYNFSPKLEDLYKEYCFLEDLYKEYCFRELPSYFGEKYELENKRIREQYETKVDEICHENPNHEKVFDFLHMCDSGGEIDSDICKAIWEVIKDHDDNENYGGYYGTDEPFTFSTF